MKDFYFRIHFMITIFRLFFGPNNFIRTKYNIKICILDANIISAGFLFLLANLFVFVKLRPPLPSIDVERNRNRRFIG